MRILIVEDDHIVLYLLKRILAQKKYEIFLAKDGVEALDIISRYEIDIVLTDWMMPRLNGLELIQLIREKVKPSPVIIVITSLNLTEAREKAFDSGADDYIVKPFEKDELLERIEINYSRRKQSIFHLPETTEIVNRKAEKLIGIGIAASTGGPKIVLNVIKDIGKIENSAIFIVLHGPKWMLESFIVRLQQQTEMICQLGEDNLDIKPGHIYLAPGDKHMIIDPKDFVIRLNDDPPENFVKPAADPLFRSLAKTFGKNAVGIVLTGMGKDGSIGAGFISVNNGFVIAQDPADAVIASMPQTVIELKLANKILKHNLIGAEVRNYVKNFTFN